MTKEHIRFSIFKINTIHITREKEKDRNNFKFLSDCLIFRRAI